MEDYTDGYRRPASPLAEDIARIVRTDNSFVDSSHAPRFVSYVNATELGLTPGGDGGKSRNACSSGSVPRYRDVDREHLRDRRRDSDGGRARRCSRRSSKRNQSRHLTSISGATLFVLLILSLTVYTQFDGLK
jgi:hypothetical protein